MIKKIFAILICSLATFVLAQDKLSACTGDFINSDWSNCQGKYDWGSYIYVGEFLKNLPHGRGEKRKQDGSLIVGGIWAAGELKKQDPIRCSLGSNPTEGCFTSIEYQNGQRFVGILSNGKPEGEGILYFPDGLVRETGRWSSGELVDSFPINKSRYPFDDIVASESYKAIEAERERTRLPEQRIAFCVQTVQVSGTRNPSISMPFCQELCGKTYADRMCSEIGGNKWRIQTASPKTSPPNSQFYSGSGNCACIGQEYVLNEIKEVPAPTAANQTETREAELAKREKALAEREKMLLESENKRLRDELETERKKKK